MSTVPRSLALSALLTLAPVGIGVAVSDDPTAGRQPVEYQERQLADFDTAAAVVQRAAFCDLLPAAAVRAAIGGPTTLTAYHNGQETELLPQSDVAHEYGCHFRPKGQEVATATSQASGWVFAPPVTAAQAEALVAEPPAAGCLPVPDAPAYGTPSAATVCTTTTGRTATWRGLFGDAWLTCSVTLPLDVEEPQLLRRTGSWCVAVAEAASVPLA